MNTRVNQSLGFTLIELLIVMTIIAMATVGVVLAFPNSDLITLERDAQRLSNLMDAAKARALVDNNTIQWSRTDQGFEWKGLKSQDYPTTWLNDDVTSDIVSIDISPEPMSKPQSMVLYLKSKPTQRVTLYSDGLRPFSVESITP